MTMNTGYFLSVLGGTFLGSLLLGGYVPAAAHENLASCSH